LLFSRFDSELGSERKFFACSAFRDRKACPFFQWLDVRKQVSDKEETTGNDVRCIKVPESWPTLDHRVMRRR